MVPLYNLLQVWLGAYPWVPDGLLVLLACAVPVGIVWLVIQGVAGASTYVERKIAADIQRRVGPNQCNPGNFLGAFVRESAARANSPHAGALDRLVCNLLGALIPVFDLLDGVLKKLAPGLLIFLADGIKLIMKENIVPAAADAPLFKIAPVIVLASAFGALATVPYSSGFYVADFNIGIFYIAAVTSLETVGILMAGWASNNKWALLGGMRSAAQIVSYELPVGLAILTGILLSGTMSMQGMVYDQMGFSGDGIRLAGAAAWQQGWFWQWNLFSSPFMFVLAPVYFLAALAECNRTPFDIPEAESELVAGYHTEYSGMNFAFFFMAEYAMMCVTSAIAVTLFLGGWSTGIGCLEKNYFMLDPSEPAKGFHWWASLIHLGFFIAKTYILVLIMMWIRWTLPRFRVDQMMTLCWKKLIPLGLFCFGGVAVWMLFRPLVIHWLAGASGEPYEKAAETLANVAGIVAMVFSLIFLAWLVWFFKKPLAPEEQARRKLIADAHLNAGFGQGVA